MAANVGFELSAQQLAAFSGGFEDLPSSIWRAFRVGGPIDFDGLTESLRSAAVRHEIMRTTFAQPAGRRAPLQVVGDGGNLTVDIHEAGRADPSAAVRELTAQPPRFDVREGPLLHVTVCRLGEDDHLLVVHAHAAILDEQSLEFLVEELLGGATDEDPLQYGDYAAWQADVLDETVPATPTVEPATRLPLAGDPGPAGERRRLCVGSEVADAVACARIGEPRDVWLALWSAVIARVTGRESVTIALADHGRPVPEVERALGPFARWLPLTVDVAPRSTLRKLVAAVEAARVAAEADRERAGAQREGTLVGFAVEPPWEARHIGELELTPVGGGSSVRGVQAVLSLEPVGAELDFDVSAVGEKAARRLVRLLAETAAAAVADADADLWDLDVLQGEERGWLVDHVGRGPGLHVREPFVHHQFENQASVTPASPAVAGAGVELTYAELNARANRIAHVLLDRGIARGATVALLLDRTPALVEAVLGVLKAGATYMPLNPEHPALRTKRQLEDAGAAILLVDAANANLANSLGLAVVRPDEFPDGLADHNPPRTSEPEDVAYLIYTSGSTGEPKGVETTHAALGNYVVAVCDCFGWGGEPLSFGLVSTLSTDLGNTAVFPALTTGSCLELIPVEAAMDGAAYAAYVADRPVDVLKLAPSHLRGLLVGGGGSVLPRKRIVLGGEALSWSLVDRIRELGDCAIANHYGPTETTIGSLTYDVGKRGQAGATVPIGRPLANTTVAVVDSAGRLVPAGAPGELLIGGAGLARGYRGRPDLTAQRFVDAGPHGGPSGRVYRTGDLVRVLADGNIEFLGRADSQVKIRGQRIELGEIEAALSSHYAVDEAVVMAQPDPRGDLRLVAYVVLSSDGDLTADLGAHLRISLPEAMIPAAIVWLDAIPLLASGKLDAAALPSPESAASTGSAYVPPKTETERRLVQIWSDVLSVGRIGVTDNFFSLGGHSLLAMQVVAAIRAEFALRLPLYSMFTFPQIAALSKEIDTLRIETVFGPHLGESEDLPGDGTGAVPELERGEPARD